MSFYDGYRALGYGIGGAHVLANGKIRLSGADAIPMKAGWRYLYPNNRFMGAAPVREEILAHLAAVGPEHEIYTISLKHAIVLYPETIPLADFEQMESVRLGDADRNLAFILTAELPFGDTKKRVQIVIDESQKEALCTDKSLPPRG